jgi:hypothetical protein
MEENALPLQRLAGTSIAHVKTAIDLGVYI